MVFVQQQARLEIAMYLTIIPSGGITEPHFHPEHETAIYLLKGRIEIRYGEGLKQGQVCEAGDFIFTPPWCSPSTQEFECNRTSSCALLLAMTQMNKRRLYFIE